MIAFILLTNPDDRKWYGLMYNDELMALYLIICIYFTITNRPMIASCFFTLGLSMKAGLILLMPAFLGSLHFNHGTVVLVSSLLLIVGFQVIIALPFVFGETSIKDYLSRSKLTMEGRNQFAGANKFYDYLAASQSLSIVWNGHTVSNPCYYNQSCFANKVKLMIVFMNVYHFFLRKGCWTRCFLNLFDTFNPFGRLKYGIHT